MEKSLEIFNQMKTIMESMEEDADKCVKGVKSAAGRMRKGSSALDKLCKQFRKQSVADCKE